MNSIIDKVLGFRQASKPTPDITIQTMWYQKNPLGLPSTKLDAQGNSLQDKYLSNVAEKYLQLLDRDFPTNCTPHIWLDREINPQMIEQSNVTPKEKKILNHLLQNQNIQIHTDDELRDLITASSLSEDDKTILHELNDHPITINMGAKNDIKKLLFCFLTEGNFNSYIDFDTLEKNTQASATKDVTGNSLKIYGRGNHPTIRYSPEQQEEHFQKFISDEAYQLRYARPRHEQEEQNNSYQKKPKKTIISIPNMGFVRCRKEIDLLGIKPYDADCLRTLKNIHESLKTGEPYVPKLKALKDSFLSDHYQREFKQTTIRMAHLVTGHKPNKLSYADRIEYYKTATKLQQVIDNLTQEEKDGMGVGNLFRISSLCASVTQGAVNIYTYLPIKYGSHSSLGFDALKFSRLNKKIFGVPPKETHTHSWQTASIQRPTNLTKLTDYSEELRRDFQFLLDRSQQMEQEAAQQTIHIN